MMRTPNSTALCKSGRGVRRFRRGHKEKSCALIQLVDRSETYLARETSPCSISQLRNECSGELVRLNIEIDCRNGTRRIRHAKRVSRATAYDRRGGQRILPEYLRTGFGDYITSLHPTPWSRLTGH